MNRIDNRMNRERDVWRGILEVALRKEGDVVNFQFKVSRVPVLNHRLKSVPLQKKTTGLKCSSDPVVLLRRSYAYLDGWFSLLTQHRADTHDDQVDNRYHDRDLDQRDCQSN